MRAKQPDPAPRYGWPPILDRRMAAAYCGVDESTIDKARRDGQLLPAGRRGGVGSHTYARAELDRWMIGGEPASANARAQPRRTRPRDWDVDLAEIEAGE